MPDRNSPAHDLPPREPRSEAALRERQDELVRILTVENNTARLAQISGELEAVQRRLEEIRSAGA